MTKVATSWEKVKHIRQIYAVKKAAIRSKQIEILV